MYNTYYTSTDNIHIYKSLIDELIEGLFCEKKKWMINGTDFRVWFSKLSRDLICESKMCLNGGGEIERESLSWSNSIDRSDWLLNWFDSGLGLSLPLLSQRIAEMYRDSKSECDQNVISAKRNLGRYELNWIEIDCESIVWRKWNIFAQRTANCKKKKQIDY